MIVVKKQKVAELPPWIMEVQRRKDESHTQARRARHDGSEAVVLTTDEGPAWKALEKENGNSLNRARAKPLMDLEKAAARRSLTRKRKPNKKKSPKPLQLDELGLDRGSRWSEAPGAMFKATGAQREEMLETLSRKTKAQKALRQKLGEAFMLAYERYRSKITPGYSPISSERKLAEDAAVITLMRGLTPGRLISYWHKHIGDFTDLKTVPLRFLASASNVDRASLAVEDGKSGTAESRPKGAGGRIRIHAYGDSRALDSRLRGVLETAGFDTRDFSDRELITIQNAARARAAGRRMFVSSKLSPMVDCASKDLYAD